MDALPPAQKPSRQVVSIRTDYVKVGVTGVQTRIRVQ